jgi:alpha-L-arabinofuranosidase
VATGALGEVEVQDACALTETDPSVVNTQDDPNRVVPTPIQVNVEQATLGVELPPVAWACIRLTSRPG